MTATDLTPTTHHDDDGDQLEGDQLDDAPALFDVDDQPARTAGRHVTLTHHAAAIVYQARMLTVGDLLDCGAGMCSAVEDLARALDRGEAAHLKGAALDLVDVTHATQGHRAAVDARPATRPAVDGPGERYPRDIHTAAPRYSHADRRAPMIASIGGMAESFATTAAGTP